MTKEMILSRIEQLKQIDDTDKMVTKIVNIELNYLHGLILLNNDFLKTVRDRIQQLNREQREFYQTNHPYYNGVSKVKQLIEELYTEMLYA